MFVDFFIKRPVFASVCSLVILLVGLVSLPTLPVEQYPDISPVQVAVTANYQGASADVVEKTVTSILERQINGVEDMKYMDSISSNDGGSTITVTFEQGRNKDAAVVDVQNRVTLAEPQLPDDVKRTGVSVRKQSSSAVLGMAIFSEGNKYNNLFLSNYTDLYVLDALKRIKGVGNIQPFGERKYSMRLWIDPTRLASRNLTAQDVVSALEQQNIQVGSGQIGQPPTDDDQMYQMDLLAIGRLIEPSEFEEIVLKTGADGSLVKLKDVGRAELGAESYGTFSRYDGNAAFGMRIDQLPGSNALSVAKAIKAEMKLLSKDFPPGVKYEIPYDPTLFVEESQKEVVKTLYEAIALVVLVIFIFLQDWRATLIPAITIPVSLIGTFAAMKAFGFSLNSLSLFGITLATGLVVDDAIIVIENVARLMEEQKISARKAASLAMREVTGAVIATSLVLMAVFVPVAFFPGTAGQLYKQFALTIAFSIALSVFNALTLTPALSALLLQEGIEQHNWFFTPVNRLIDWTRKMYSLSLNWINRFKGIVLLMFIVSLGFTGWLYLQVPTAFLPEEDQGYFINIIQGPAGSSVNYTRKVIAQAEKELLKLRDVAGTFALGGFGNNGNNANNGLIFAPLKPWGERQRAEQAATALISQVSKPLSQISDAAVISINPPTIQGLGSVGGFQYKLQDRGSNGIDTLVQVKNNLLARANKLPQLKGVFSTFTADMPQLRIDVNRQRAQALQIPLDDIFNTLQIFLGSKYVNDFNLFERTYRVYVQADKQFRSNPQDIEKLQVRSKTGQMIPLSNLVKVTPKIGAQTINHFNLFRSIEINGVAAPGFSSGQAIQAMEKLSAEVLPRNMGFEWSGISLEELGSGSLAPVIFGLGIVFVFLVLAAQYENYIDPIIILLSVPLAILGALSAQSLRGLSDDVYCQIGLVMLIGLASKNAILIVEFANQLQEKGLSITKAAMESAQSRLRPILMTSLAFILGLLPMVTATGAGSVGRQSLGTAVCGGMIVSTLLSLFVVPVLYIVIGTARARINKRLHSPKRKAKIAQTSPQPMEQLRK